MRQPDGSTVDPSARDPGTSRVATNAAPAMAGTASTTSSERVRMSPQYERLGGRLDVLYSPDAFGHPAAWPTLAREFGIRYGVVWRGLGGEAGQERDLYRWRGLDGKEILLWHLPPAGYELGVSLPADRDRLIAAWAPVRSVLVQRAAGKHIPVFIGADHHAAHPDVPQLRDLLAELDPQSAF